MTTPAVKTMTNSTPITIVQLNGVSIVFIYFAFPFLPFYPPYLIDNNNVTADKASNNDSHQYAYSILNRKVCRSAQNVKKYLADDESQQNSRENVVQDIGHLSRFIVHCDITPCIPRRPFPGRLQYGLTVTYRREMRGYPGVRQLKLVNVRVLQIAAK
jgi:hypothetical protein